MKCSPDSNYQKTNGFADATAGTDITGASTEMLYFTSFFKSKSQLLYVHQSEHFFSLNLMEQNILDVHCFVCICLSFVLLSFISQKADQEQEPEVHKKTEFRKDSEKPNLSKR